MTKSDGRRLFLLYGASYGWCFPSCYIFYIKKEKYKLGLTIFTYLCINNKPANKSGLPLQTRHQYSNNLKNNENQNRKNKEMN